MKKVLLSALFITGLFNSQAQIKQGTFALGGNIGIQIQSSSYKDEGPGLSGTPVNNPSLTTYKFLPTAQYFLADNFSIGLQIGIGGSSTTTKATLPGTSDTTNSTTAFIIAPFARYYYMLEDNVGLFAQGAFNLESDSYSKTGSINNPSGTNLGFGLSPGIIFFPGNRIGIEATIGNVIGFQSQSYKTPYPNNNTHTETHTKLDILNLNSLSLSLGFQYYFGRPLK